MSRPGASGWGQDAQNLLLDRVLVRVFLLVDDLTLAVDYDVPLVDPGGKRRVHLLGRIIDHCEGQRVSIVGLNLLTQGLGGGSDICCVDHEDLLVALVFELLIARFHHRTGDKFTAPSPLGVDKHPGAVGPAQIVQLDGIAVAIGQRQILYGVAHVRPVRARPGTHIRGHAGAVLALLVGSRTRTARTTAAVVATFYSRALRNALAGAVLTLLVGSGARAARSAAAVVATFYSRALRNALAGAVVTLLVGPGARAARSAAAVVATFYSRALRNALAGAVVTLLVGPGARAARSPAAVVATVFSRALRNALAGAVVTLLVGPGARAARSAAAVRATLLGRGQAIGLADAGARVAAEARITGSAGPTTTVIAADLALACRHTVARSAYALLAGFAGAAGPATAIIPAGLPFA